MAEHTVDLDGYCRRIDYDGPREPTLAVLRDLARLHTRAIPFENLDPLLGRAPKLDAASLDAKLVHGRRGGYCFEHNTLLQHVVIAFGFEARALGARVLLNQPDDVVPSRTHMLLRVEVEGRSFLADVGFGGLTPTGPLLFETRAAQETLHESYRLEEAGQEFELFVKVGDGWRRLYRFHLIEQFAIDHEVGNHFIASRAESFFRNAIVAARATPDGRHLLLNDRLTFQRIDGSRNERTLSDAEALIQTLDETFGIDIPDASALAETFDRLTATQGSAGQQQASIHSVMMD